MSGLLLFVLVLFGLGSGLLGVGCWFIHTADLAPYKKAHRRLAQAYRDVDNIFYTAHELMNAVARDRLQPGTFRIGGR